MSTALQLAQQKLMQLRANLGINAVPIKQDTVEKTTVDSSLPEHLGWHSKAVTEQLRRHADRKIEQRECSAEVIPSPPIFEIERIESTPVPVPIMGKNVSICPSFAMSILKEEVSASARIWLLLRGMDHFGRGVISIAQARSVLTSKSSAYKVCGWRQLRNLLSSGEGIFWQRDKTMIWLASPARVGMRLGVDRFAGKLVSLSTKTLCRSIGDVKAHLYEAFHAGRKTDAPIARDTLRSICGMSENTQRSYEERANISAEAQFSIEQQWSDAGWEELAWKHGRKAFKFKDKRGFHGTAGQTYIATQLPNRYDVKLTSERSRHNRRWNRQLADLLNQGTVGNDQTIYSKRYCENSVSAYKQSDGEQVYPSVTPRFWYATG